MRYLIYGGPGIGDTIIELALAKGIKKNDSSAQIDLLISGKLGTENLIQELIECQSYVDNLYCITRDSIWETVRTLLKLKFLRYSYGFSCTTEFKATKKPAMLFKLLGCKSVVKCNNGKSGKADILVDVPENIHFVEQNGALLKAIGFESVLDLEVLDVQTIRDLFPVASCGQRIVTICLGTNITIYWKDGQRIDKNIKEWPIQNWVTLANQLSAQGHQVVMIGGRKEKESLQSVVEPLREDVIVVAGETSIKESLSVLAQSDLVLGADTGMMHCAAALGKPTITLFGGTDPNVWKPYSNQSKVITGNCKCAPCYGKNYAIECDNRECMKMISCEDVLNVVLSQFAL